jgi:hypothetical protein
MAISEYECISNLLMVVIVLSLLFLLIVEHHLFVLLSSNIHELHCIERLIIRKILIMIPILQQRVNAYKKCM